MLGWFSARLICGLDAAVAPTFADFRRSLHRITMRNPDFPKIA